MSSQGNQDTILEQNNLSKFVITFCKIDHSSVNKN